ncbi:MAG: site-specific integrase [Candidatus Latescibacterota bacterium]|nr:MAG: site-specific integrase [Candidatus Latescibacterota bacterium]
MAKRTLKQLEPGEVAHLDRGIFVRKNRNGTLSYGISYLYKGTLIREIIGPTKTLAKQVLQSRKSEIAQDKFKIPKKRRSPKFDTVCDRYLEHAKKEKKSWQRDELALKIAKKFFKKKRIDELAPFDFERFKAARADQVSKSTVNRDLSVLKRLFNLAIDWNLVATNPLKKVAVYRLDEKTMRVLSHEEERRLIEAAAPHIRPLIIVAINTGMRRGELLSLQWEQVDLQSRTITIKHSKNGRVRHIPINKTTQEAFVALPEPHTGHVFRYHGSPIKEVKSAFAGAVRRAAIPHCTLHSCRHTFATRLVSAGVDLATVKELLGHASVSTTMKYTHPAPQHKRDAVGRLDSHQPIDAPLEVVSQSD